MSVELKDQYLKRVHKRHENSKYYRIKAQYVHHAIIQLSSFQNKRLKTKTYSETLNIFNGKIISRVDFLEEITTEEAEDKIEEV